MARTNAIVGLVCIAAALVLLLVWIPLDTETGLIEKVRRRVTIGDALAPTLAAVFILVSGIMMLAFERKSVDQGGLSRANLGYIAAMVAVLAIGSVAMRYTGPLAADLASGTEYRLLRDTVPWKYLGFILGGTIAIAGMIGVIEGRPSLRGAAIGLGGVLVMIAIFDLPFEDLLLPPNGDV